MKDLGTVRHNIQKSYKKLHNWRKVGAEFGVTSGMAFRIATQDYEPKSPHVRHILGLPTLIPAPACGKCGQVHVSKRCPSGKKPAKNWRGEGEAWWQRFVEWISHA